MPDGTVNQGACGRAPRLHGVRVVEPDRSLAPTGSGAALVPVPAEIHHLFKGSSLNIGVGDSSHP